MVGEEQSSNARGTRVQSVERAVRLLMAVARNATDNSGKELAQHLGLPVATAHHLLSTLVDQGLLMRTDRSRYALGPLVATLANAFYRGDNAPEALLGPLRQLAQSTGETAYITTMRGADFRVLATLEGTQPLRVSVPAQPYQDAHARAAGKLLLAYAPEDVVTSYLRSNVFRPRTPNTIIDPIEFEAELLRIRERGYAIDNEEFEIGISCISVPVLDGDEVLVAYSLSVPTSRFVERQASLLRAASTVAESVRRRITLDSPDDDAEDGE